MTSQRSNFIDLSAITIPNNHTTRIENTGKASLGDLREQSLALGERMSELQQIIQDQKKILREICMP